jgi:hypothetical protein
MFCFALGNKRRLLGEADVDLSKSIRELGLGERYKRVLDKDSSILYARLWAEMRQRKDLAPSFNLVMRYWILAAMCDGLAVAWFVWAIVWTAWAHAPDDRCVAGPSYWAKIAVVVVFVIVGAFCWAEAGRYGRYQKYEIVATLGYAHEDTKK